MAPLLGRGPNISIKIKTKEVRKDLTQLLGREAGPRRKHSLLPECLQSSELSFHCLVDNKYGMGKDRG